MEVFLAQENIHDWNVFKPWLLPVQVDGGLDARVAKSLANSTRYARLLAICEVGRQLSGFKVACRVFELETIFCQIIIF